MKLFMRIGLYCLLLSYNHIVLAQHPEPADPCGDAAIESQAWSTVRGRVVKVEDGDTIIISVKGSGLRSVHLNGIAAPEHGQRFAKEAHRLLERLVQGKMVDVWLNPKRAREVRQKRYPARVPISGVVRLRDMKMLDVNLLMIQAGVAQYKGPEPYSMSGHSSCHYARAEDEARAARRGLWRRAA